MDYKVQVWEVEDGYPGQKAPQPKRGPTLVCQAANDDSARRVIKDMFKKRGNELRTLSLTTLPREFVAYVYKTPRKRAAPRALKA